MPAGQVSLHLAVFGMVGDRVSRGGSRGGVAVAVVAMGDIHTDPEKDSAGGVVVLVVGRDEALVSSFVPCLGPMPPYLD
jgi:hypothetical protein